MNKTIREIVDTVIFLLIAGALGLAVASYVVHDKPESEGVGEKQLRDSIDRAKQEAEAQRIERALREGRSE